MSKTSKGGIPIQPIYSVPTKVLHKFQSTSNARSYFPANLNDGLTQLPSSSQISSVENTVLIGKPFGTAGHSKEAKLTNPGKFVSETSKQYKSSQNYSRNPANTQSKRVSYVNDTSNRNNPQGFSKKAKKISNKNLASSESNVTKFDSPFVRGLEDFITTDNRDSKDSTHLRCSKALSTENITKFGKQRTVPKTKRPSRLKRCILSERAVRSELRSQSLPATKITLDHLETVVSTSELGQAKLNTLDVRKTVANCSKPPSTMQKDLITELITQLAIFQDRAYVIYANNPFYRKRAKRFVCGFHEVVKHLKLKHMRIIIVARDLEGNATDCIRQNKIGVKGQDNEVKVVLTALEEKLCQIWRLADEYEPPVPIMVSHTRRKLARLCHKPSFVSIVGIINADGAYEVERKLLDMKAGVNLGISENLEIVQTGDKYKYCTSDSITAIVDSLLFSVKALRIEE